MIPLLLPFDRIIRFELCKPPAVILCLNRITVTWLRKGPEIWIPIVLMHVNLQSKAHLPQVVVARGQAGARLGVR